jgi:flavorubredoxin
LLVGVGLASFALTLWVERERGSAPRLVNGASTRGAALVVYHPGLQGFQERVTIAFTDGLAAAGWRVEITTASRVAPGDVSGYDLLVVGSPTYWWQPARPVTDYLDRLGNLDSKPTVVLVTGSGQGERSTRLLGDKIRDAGGRVFETLTLYAWRPNAEGVQGNNKQIAADIAYQAGAAIPPPRP